MCVAPSASTRGCYFFLLYACVSLTYSFVNCAGAIAYSFLFPHRPNYSFFSSRCVLISCSLCFLFIYRCPFCHFCGVKDRVIFLRGVTFCGLISRIALLMDSCVSSLGWRSFPQLHNLVSSNRRRGSLRGQKGVPHSWETDRASGNRVIWPSNSS